METNDILNPDVLTEPAGITQSADGTPPSENDVLRLQRILEYTTVALGNPNLLQSNLASINCGLMKMVLWLEQTIEEAMTTSSITPDLMQQVYKAMDMILRLARQIDRFAQVELRNANSRERGSKAKTSVDSVANSETPTGASEESAS